MQTTGCSPLNRGTDQRARLSISMKWSNRFHSSTGDNDGKAVANTIHSLIARGFSHCAALAISWPAEHFNRDSPRFSIRLELLRNGVDLAIAAVRWNG